MVNRGVYLSRLEHGMQWSRTLVVLFCELSSKVPGIQVGDRLGEGNATGVVVVDGAVGDVCEELRHY